jgi:hemerythrin-like domain-containing protein
MHAAASVAALITVEEDHRLVLEKMHALRDAISWLITPGSPGPRRALERLREVHDYFATHFAAHLLEEERTLFPYLRRCLPDGPDLVARLQAEHAEIRHKREEFGNCLDVAAELGDKLPSAVFNDLLVFGWELWDILDHHAHAETYAVQRCLARSLPAAAAPAPVAAHV